ncbi:MAG: lytic transglycosylase domain-containing protein, partial [Myxococcota bacterium]
PDEATAGVWRQSFPVPFGDEAQTAVAQAGISKSLLYAIMRHESGFSPTALSPVGARGLVQLMPTSARGIAELYGIPSLGAGALSRPGYNLQIGALFLSQLLSFYRSNHVIVAAAYNAGPYAAAGWVKKWRHLPTDAFVESIPYPITRTYVMQVTASAQTYAWLYPEWGEIERDQLGRSPAMPGTFGPFMKRPDDSESLRAAVN